MKDHWNWLDTDRGGLEKIARRRGLAYVLYELVADAWDTEARFVHATFEPIKGRPLVRVRVEDDDPDGFADITHAYTLFAESSRKADPNKRGKFNLGLKLVLAVCESAEIVSTRAAVRFDRDGRHASKRRRERGSEFDALVRMSRSELAEVRAAGKLLLAPARTVTTIDGEPIASRAIRAHFEARLPTEYADETGYLHRTARLATVHVHDPSGDCTDGVRKGRLYELGIPVCTTDLPWDLDVQQKVPVNLERNAVPPEMIRTLAVCTYNVMAETITDSEASAPVALEVLGDARVFAETAAAILRETYGEKVAFEDPRDREAENRLKADGYAIVPVRSMPTAARAKLLTLGLVQRAGDLRPTPKPYSTDADAPPRQLLAEAAWTEGMAATAAYARRLADRLLGVPIRVVFDVTPGTRNWQAAYGGRELVFNVNVLGRPFFDQGMTLQLNALLIHEFAHETEKNHLSREFYWALQDLGARMVRLALTEPEVFTQWGLGMASCA